MKKFLINFKFWPEIAVLLIALCAVGFGPTENPKEQILVVNCGKGNGADVQRVIITNFNKGWKLQHHIRTPDTNEDYSNTVLIFEKR